MSEKSIKNAPQIEANMNMIDKKQEGGDLVIENSDKHIISLLEEYKDFTTELGVEQTEEDRSFLKTCAYYGFKLEIVKRIYPFDKDARNRLCKMYINTFTIMDNTCVSKWFDRGVKITEEYSTSMYFNMLISTVLSIAVDLNHPYEEYQTYFDEKDDKGDPIKISELIAIKNSYQNSKEKINQLKEVFERVPNVLKQNDLESQIKSLELKVVSLSDEVNEKQYQLEELERRVKEAAEEETSQEKAGSKKKNKVFFKRKSKKQLISRMIEMGYNAERIRIIKDALLKGVAVTTLIGIVELDVETEILRETVGCLQGKANL